MIRSIYFQCYNCTPSRMGRNRRFISFSDAVKHIIANPGHEVDIEIEEYDEDSDSHG